MADTQGFGCLEGLPVSELVEAAGKAQVRAREYTPSGGETLEAVDHRLALFLAELFRYYIHVANMPHISLKLYLVAEELSVSWN